MLHEGTKEYKTAALITPPAPPPPRLIKEGSSGPIKSTKPSDIGEIVINFDENGDLVIDKGTGTFYIQACIIAGRDDINCGLDCPKLTIVKDIVNYNGSIKNLYKIKGCSFEYITCNKLEFNDWED